MSLFIREDILSQKKGSFFLDFGFCQNYLEGFLLLNL